MDHEHGVIRVDHEHNLEEPAASPRTPYQILLVVLDERKGSPSAADDIFSVLRCDAVPGHMFFIPFVPSKLHESSATDGNLLYKKLGPRHTRLQARTRGRPRGRSRPSRPVGRVRKAGGNSGAAFPFGHGSLPTHEVAKMDRNRDTCPSLPFAQGPAPCGAPARGSAGCGLNRKPGPSLALAPAARASSPLGDFSRCEPGPGRKTPSRCWRLCRIGEQGVAAAAVVPDSSTILHPPVLEVESSVSVP
jgi:hypothetical protein